MRLLGFLILLSSLCAFADSPSPLLTGEGQKVLVNNRILAKVNGKTISVIDLMKKMDVMMNRNYPEMAGNPAARYQFFASNWRGFLEQMIDNELMLADAEKLEIKLTDGDIRESLQEKFGPNVMANLDKLGMTYEEAWNLIRSELMGRRINWFRVTSKALQSVNPQDIKTAYKEYLRKNPPEEKWVYQVLSIRSEDPQEGEKKAEQAYAMLCEQKKAFEEIPSLLEKDDKVKLSLSTDYEVLDNQLSLSHKEALHSLVVGGYSQPLLQKSRLDGGVVIRLFHLKDHTKQEPPTFEALSDKLYEELMDKAIDREATLYVTKLREKFTHDEKNQEPIPADFEPFMLK